MAVGNVGEHLSFAQDFTCTYLSQDGGETWQDIDPRAMVFEFGDAVSLSVSDQAGRRRLHPLQVRAVE